MEWQIDLLIRIGCVIAGTAFLNKPGFWLAAEGATGFGVRLLIEYLKNLT